MIHGLIASTALLGVGFLLGCLYSYWRQHRAEIMASFESIHAKLDSLLDKQ